MDNRLTYVGLAVLAGAASALQGATNSGLAARIGLAGAALLNALVLLALTLTFWVLRGPHTSLTPAGTPPWAYIGGLLGFTIIVGMAVAFPRLGGAFTIALMVLGQGLVALTIDHFGLFGMPAQSITLPRAGGVLLLAAGVLLLRSGR